MSKSAVDRLGDRLRKASPPERADLEMLQEFVRSHAVPLAAVVDRLREVLPDQTVTQRLKTRDTIIEKLIRERSRLSTIQDIAGARLSPVRNLTEQDDVVERIVDAFESVRVRDRRKEPSFGYRAVHAIVSVEGFSVEIQVRTVGQDQWAQMFESLADRWGRQIRYGEPPDDVAEALLRVTGAALTRGDFCAELRDLSGLVALNEELDVEIAALMQELARQAVSQDAGLREEVSALRERNERTRAKLEDILERAKQFADGA